MDNVNDVEAIKYEKAIKYMKVWRVIGYDPLFSPDLTVYDRDVIYSELAKKDVIFDMRTQIWCVQLSLDI